MIIYGVFKVPRCMMEAREVESVWTLQERPNERAITRSIHVHGTVRGHSCSAYGRSW